MVRFGFNWDSGSVSFEAAIPAMQASNADAHLIMIDSGGFFLRSGDLDTIRKVANAVPRGKLIIRLYSRQEGNWQNYPKASEYGSHWAWVRGQLGDTLTSRLVFDSPFNEPNLAGDNATLAKPFVAYCVQLVIEAYRAEVKLAIGAFSVGTPHESLIETEYRPLWKALADYKQALSVHLYGAIPSEAGELAPLEAVLHASTARNYMSADKWPISHQGWLMARPYRVIEYFRKNGLGIPEIYITECFVDNIFNSQTSWIKEAWKSNYPSVKYPDPRGVQAWEEYLKDMFPEKPFDEAVAHLLSHARKNIFYHEAFKGACLFALNKQWGYPSGSNKEAGSNYEDSQFSRFRATLLPQVNAESYEDTVMIRAKISSKTTSNIRPQADTSSLPILLVLTNAWLEVLISEDPVTTNDGYEWYEVKTDSLHGYVAKTDNLVIEKIVETPTEQLYEVALGYATLRMTAQQVDWLATIFEGMAFATRNAPPVE